MSWPAYPEYKDSGVDWLGTVPAHWSIKPLWTLYRRTKRTGYATETLLSVYREYGIIEKSSRSDNYNKPSEDLSGYQLVEPGDLAINKMKAWQGSVGVSGYRGIVSPAYHVYTTTHKFNSRYLHHLFRCQEYIAGYQSNSKGIRVNQWDLEPDQHSRMPVLLPELDEQNRIAEFLDHETARIDALIEEQQRLIDLLQEKRQAVILHAVINGLNPNVPMKDSGVDWLGRIPAHWKVVKASYIGLFFGSDGISEDLIIENEGHIPILKVAELSTDRLQVSQLRWYLHESIQTQFTPRSHFVVFPKRGAAIFLNKVNVVEQPAVLDPNLMGWKILDEYSTDYFAHALKCRELKELADISSVPQLNHKHVAPERFPVPPKEEQEEIAAHISTEVERFAQLISEAERSIELLQERRSALISAAVTGKIDVRGWKPRENTVEHDLPMAAEAEAQYG